MIITKELQEDKINKKLMPTRFKVVVSFLNFILTEDEGGLVLYSNDTVWRPFEFIEEIKLKKIKAKVYNDFLEFNKHCDHTKKYIKKCKTSFFDAFDTSCEVKLEKEFFELDLENDEVVLTKHIVCVIKELDNIERTFVKDESVCRVVPISKVINGFENKEIENWLKYFLIKG